MTAMHTTTIEITAAELAARAADEIERRGLNKGDYADSADPVDFDDCKVCAYGAMNYLLEGNPHKVGPFGGNPIRREVAAVITGRLPHEGSWKLTLDEWNDRPETTQELVVFALRRAAQDLAAPTGTYASAFKLAAVPDTAYAGAL